MTQVYFHCSNSREVRIDRSGEAVSDLAEARDRAVGIVRSLIMHATTRDAVARPASRRARRRQTLIVPTPAAYMAVRFSLILRKSVARMA